MSVSRQYYQSFVRYEVAYARVRGSDPICALFLSYMAFRCSDGRLANESHEKCERFTGLSRKQQDRARDFWVRAGVLQTTVQGTPPTLWYTMDFEALDVLLEAQDAPLQMSERDKSICPKGTPQMSQTDKCKCPKGANALDREEQDKEQKNTPLPPEPVSREDREVEEVYAAYPRKVAKGQAIRAIRAALKRAGFEVLLAATQAYADAVARWAPEERQFVPFPATWFNGHRWEDDRSTWDRPGGRAPAERPVPGWLVQKRQRLLEEWQEIERERRRAIAQGLTPQRNAATFADIERRLRAAQAALEAEGGSIPTKVPA